MTSYFQTDCILIPRQIIRKIVIVANFPFIFPRRSYRRDLSLFESRSLEKGFSLAKSINFTEKYRKKHSDLPYLESTRTDPAIGVPFDFKVNTPLKSHQSKIESLTVARVDCFTFSQTMGTATTLGVCIHRM